MKNKTFESNIKDYYVSKELSPNMLARLQTMQDVDTQHGNKMWRFLQAKPYIAIAASMLLVVMLGMQFMVTPSPQQLMDSVVKEVVLNHQKNLAIEFAAHDYGTLAKAMNKLDFTIKAPSAIQVADYVLLGSRYCSIQGYIAAQIKLEDKQGKAMTLYITRLNDDLAMLQGKQQQHKQLQVKTWYEGELFYSLAYSK